MARNGSGTFTRDNGTFTGSTVWADDRDAGTKIVASNHDTHDQDIADALTASLAKDGQTTPTANLPMGGYAHTNVAEGTSRNQYAAISQVQDGELTYVALAGSSNVFTGSLSPALTAYQTGQLFLFVPNHTINGAATINLNSLGAKNVKVAYATTMRATAENDIASGSPFLAYYDGTDFVIVNQPPMFFKSWTPTLGAATGTYTGSTSYAKWARQGEAISIKLQADGTTSSSTAYLSFTLPITPANTSNAEAFAAWGVESSITIPCITKIVSATTVAVYRYDNTNWGAGSNRTITVNGWYEAA